MKLFLHFIVFCFFVTSTASAAMPCCASKAMKMDKQVEMSCHKVQTAKKDDKTVAVKIAQKHLCDDCNCQGCFKTSAIITPLFPDVPVRMHLAVESLVVMSGESHDSIYYPPRSIS